MLQFAGYKQVAGILYAFWQSTASVELSFYQCNGFIAVTQKHCIMLCAAFADELLEMGLLLAPGFNPTSSG